GLKAEAQRAELLFGELERGLIRRFRPPHEKLLAWLQRLTAGNRAPVRCESCGRFSPPSRSAAKRGRPRHDCGRRSREAAAARARPAERHGRYRAPATTGNGRWTNAPGTPKIPGRR